MQCCLVLKLSQSRAMNILISLLVAGTVFRYKGNGRLKLRGPDLLLVLGVSPFGWWLTALLSARAAVMVSVRL